MTDTEYALEIFDLTVAYDANPVLWDIDLQIPKGVLAAVIGPNGAGKSTLIKSILGLVRPVAGQIKVFGESHKKQQKLLGYVPQRASVDWDFPTTVLDAVMMGSYGRLGWIKRPGKKEKQQSLKALDSMGIATLATRQIGELSGGQQQRMFLARALVQDSELYLMDEPLQGVDIHTEKVVIDQLRELRKQGKSIVVVHHDLHTVPDYYDWTVLINKRLMASGTVKDAFTEETIRETYKGQTSYVHFDDEPKP